MAIPPRGDPRRTLHLAARYCRVTAIAALLPVGLLALGLILENARRRGLPDFLPFLIVGVPPALVSAAYFLFAVNVKRARRWSIVAALSLSALLAGFWLLLALLFVGGPGGLLWVGRDPFVTGLIVVDLVVEATLGRLIYLLIRSLAARHLLPTGDVRGFQVVPLPARPTPADGADDDAPERTVRPLTDA